MTADTNRHPVSKSIAKKFAGMYPTPHPGDRIVVAINPATRSRLHLENVAGSFVLVCDSHTKDQWSEEFQVNPEVLK